MKKVLFSPHNDDETLFTAFTVARYADDIEVVLVFDSFKQFTRGLTKSHHSGRRRESIQALLELGVSGNSMRFVGIPDDADVDVPDLFPFLKAYEGYEVWAPRVETGGNVHHNMVGEACVQTFGDASVHQYLTYTTAGKSTWGKEVKPNRPIDVGKKHRALARYISQFEVPDCLPHFLRSQEEYVA